MSFSNNSNIQSSFPWPSGKCLLATVFSAHPRLLPSSLLPWLFGTLPSHLYPPSSPVHSISATFFSLLTASLLSLQRLLVNPLHGFQVPGSPPHSVSLCAIEVGSQALYFFPCCQLSLLATISQSPLGSCSLPIFTSFFCPWSLRIWEL